MATEEKYIALDYQGRRFSKPKKIQLTKPIAALSPNDMAAKQKKENKWGASLIPIQNFTGEKPKIPKAIAPESQIAAKKRKTLLAEARLEENLKVEKEFTHGIYININKMKIIEGHNPDEHKEDVFTGKVLNEVWTVVQANLPEKYWCKDKN